MGKGMLREQRVRALVHMAKDRLADGLTIEEVRESVRRYVLIHYGGCLNTVASYVDEVLLKVEYEREREYLTKNV